MPIATRTFRVFVSSTFEDLKAERDALQHDVFPKLRTLCEQHGARFQAIDLRWGVRDEAALDQQTMAICLREIQRCKATGVRPNFITLLGDRYGWRPLPVTIPAAEFEALRAYLPARDSEVALQWYRLDENAVPPEYCLQPRTGEFVEPSAWNPVEESLLRALTTAARAAGLSEKELIKYEASATHQEILAGLGETEEDRQHVFGFVRRPTGNTDARLDALKSHLRAHEFDAGDMKGLCELVLTQLTEVIEAEVKRFEDRPALDIEIESHDRFAEERCRVFTGREAALNTIADYIRGPERRPLVLHGESGSGKSAAMAKASQEYKGPGRVIRRFIGASPESASGHALLTSLCRQIGPGDTPVDYVQLESAFWKQLRGATGEQPLVLFIDALDQLAASDPARAMTWLPQQLPPNVKVILSTTDDGERLPDGLGVRLEHMARPEAGRALDEMLLAAGRRCQAWQRDFALARFEHCGLPLYLKLAAEETRLWKSYTTEAACKLGEDIAGVIDTLFDRLASNANHGPTLVERSLGYLAAARYGLTENEVLDVLTADDAVWNDFDERKRHEVGERRLPVVVWSRLSLDLEPYLTERAAPGGKVIAFFHRQIAERVPVRFLDGTEFQARHSDLARYFLARPMADSRRLVELVFQQRGARQWTGAEATLFDARFLFAKVSTELVLDLDSDYKSLLRDAPEGSLPGREALRLIHGALQLTMHVIARVPAQFASQMVGRLLAHRDNAYVTKFLGEVTAAAPRPWIRPLHPCLDSPGGALLRTLEGHTNGVSSVAVTPDGKQAVSASVDKTLKVWDLDTGRVLHTLAGHTLGVIGVAMTPGGKCAVSASADKTLKVWALKTGQVLRTLEGHSAQVEGVAVTPNGDLVVSASEDKTLKVWDLDTGRVLHTLAGHTLGVIGVAVTPDGKQAISASADKTLKVWDLETGRELRTLEGHSGYVNGVAMTPDGKLAVSASEDETLKVWDLETGRVLHTLAGHNLDISGVAVTPDGKCAISASMDGAVKVWDLETGSELLTLAGKTSGVSCVAVTPNGKWAVSGCNDSELRVWDLDSGLAVHQMENHSHSVAGVAVIPDAQRAVSASWDSTLKVWDLKSGSALHTLEGHSHGVNSVAVAPDGKWAVSASMDGTLKVWDLDTGLLLRTLEGHVARVEGVAVTPDGKWAVSVSQDKTLKVWDVDTGRTLRTMNTSELLGVAVTPDGKRAVSASKDKTLKVWALDTGRALRTLRGHCSWVWGVAVTPDGKQAISASDDKTLKVWDLGVRGWMQDQWRSRALRTLEGHSDGVWGVAVTPDGKRVVSASDDRTLKVWDLDTGLPIATFHCEASARCCAFADDRHIVAGDFGGRLYVLALEE